MWKELKFYKTEDLFKAKRRNYINETKFIEFYDGAFHLMNMMNAFKKNIK